MLAAFLAVLPLMLFFSPGKSLTLKNSFAEGPPSPGVFIPSSYDYAVPDDWILQAPAQLTDPGPEHPLRSPHLDLYGKVPGDALKVIGRLKTASAVEAGAAVSGENTYGGTVSAIISSSTGPGGQGRSIKWEGWQMLPDRTSMWLEKDPNLPPGTSYYGPPPDYDHEASANGPWTTAPDSGTGVSQKTWKPSGEDTVFYSLDGDYNFPCGRKFGGGMEQYSFNTTWRYETTRLAPVIMDAQATDGYLPGNIMPLGFQLGARASIKKATVSGSYGVNADSMDFDSMSPFVHQFGGNLNYRLSPKVDVNGEATCILSDFAPSDGQMYQGGLNWRPSVADAIAGSVKLTDSGASQSYDIFAMYQRKLAPAESLSFNSDFNQDLYHFIHERLSLAYAWKWGKYFLSAALGATMDEEPAPGRMLMGKTCTIGITRTFGLPIAGIF